MRIMERFSGLTEKGTLIRKRQPNAVACIILLIFMFLFSKTETIIIDEEALSQIDTSKPIAGIFLELDNSLEYASAIAEKNIINIEKNNISEVTSSDETTPNIEENTSVENVDNSVDNSTEVLTRDNTLYYIEDNGYVCYLDNAYQDYLWNKLSEYNSTYLYETCIALMYHESKFNINCVSSTNDHGLMQINIGNYQWLHDTLGINSLDDPYDNINCGVYMLVNNIQKYGNIEKALVAYNQGHCGETMSTDYSQCILYHDLYCLRRLDEE